MTETAIRETYIPSAATLVTRHERESRRAVADAPRSVPVRPAVRVSWLERRLNEPEKLRRAMFISVLAIGVVVGKLLAGLN